MCFRFLVMDRIILSIVIKLINILSECYVWFCDLLVCLICLFSLVGLVNLFIVFLCLIFGWRFNIDLLVFIGCFWFWNNGIECWVRCYCEYWFSVFYYLMDFF